MAGVVNKIWNFLGMDSERAVDDEMLDDDSSEYLDDDDQTEERRSIFSRNKNTNVVNMPAQQIKMVISQPTSFEQSEEICNYLKDRKSVIVNLEYVNKDIARRIIDFISGGVHALDGHIQKISNSIFLIAPVNYEISNDIAREEIKNKLSVSWLKNN